MTSPVTKLKLTLAYNKETIAKARKDRDAAKALIAKLKPEIADLKAQIAALSVSSKKRTALGLAVPGGDPDEFRLALKAGVKPKWARLYAKSIPANFNAWGDAKAAHDLGLNLWLSLALSIDAQIAGTTDKALAAFVKTLPAGTRLSTNHEPSNHTKGITAAEFTAAWNHSAKVILDASGGKVLPGPIEVQANVVHKGYLDKLDPKLVKFVGLDGYDGIGGSQNATRTFEQVASASFAHARKLFPKAPIGFAEFNSSRAVGWALWVSDSLQWMTLVGADVAVLFTSLDYWQKTPTELSSLAALLK